MTHQLSVHQRVRFGGPSRQGLRPDFGCHPRCLHRERHQARHRRREPGEYPARLRDAVHDQQDRHCRRGPRPAPLFHKHRRQSGGQSRDDRRRSRATWSRTSATTRRAFPITAPTSRCCCTASRPTSPWASMPRRKRRRAGRRRRPGHDVRLRLHRERGLREELVHAGADLFRAQDPQSAVGEAPLRRSCSICSPTPRARSRCNMSTASRSAAPRSWSRRSTMRRPATARNTRPAWSGSMIADTVDIGAAEGLDAEEGIAIFWSIRPAISSSAAPTATAA